MKRRGFEDEDDYDLYDCGNIKKQDPPEGKEKIVLFFFNNFFMFYFQS